MDALQALCVKTRKDLWLPLGYHREGKLVWDVEGDMVTFQEVVCRLAFRQYRFEDDLNPTNKDLNFGICWERHLIEGEVGEICGKCQEEQGVDFVVYFRYKVIEGILYAYSEPVRWSSRVYEKFRTFDLKF